MKKGHFLLLVGFFVLLATVFVVRGMMEEVTVPQKSTTIPTPTSISPNTNSPSLASRLLQSVTLTVPDTPGNPKVTLAAWKGMYDQEGYEAWITMLPDRTAERTTVSGTDLIGIYTINYGGSGVFYYLGLFQSAGNVVTQQGAELIGSQLHITALDIVADPSGASDYEVVVSFLELAPNEANADAPKHNVKRVFKVQENKFLPQ